MRRLIAVSVVAVLLLPGCEESADDQREIPPYRNPSLEATGWGLHLVDYNPALDDLIDLVKQQAAAKR